MNLAGAKLIDSSDKIRATKCRDTIMKILKAHDCVIVPGITIYGGGVVKSEWIVQALPRKQLNVEPEKGNGN